MTVLVTERLDVLEQIISSFVDLGYQIGGAREFLEVFESSDAGRVLVMRHDVDADMRAAARFAGWEQGLGITGTYLVMMQSPLYNLFSRASCRSMDAILSGGHEIGLHFDIAFNESRTGDLTDLIDSQAQVISDFFSVPVTTFSAHQPTTKALDPESYKGKLTSCYTDPAMNRLAYFSDSNRERDIRELVELAAALAAQSIEDAPGIQLLTHPMWWIYDDKDPADVWDRALQSNLASAQDQLALTERAFGSPRLVRLSKPSDEGLGVT